MEKLALILVLALGALGFAGEFDDFEKSLMTPQASNDGSSNNESSDNSTEAFEQSLMTTGDSEMEPIYKLRETLLENIKKRDTAQVSKNISELESMQTKQCLPIVDLEKKMIYLDLKMYRRLIPHMVHEYRAAYDTLEVDPGYKFPDDDGLHIYIAQRLQELDTSRTLYAQYSQSVEKAWLTEEEKRELEVLMQLDGAYKDEKAPENMLQLVKNFVDKYPNNPDVPWIKKSVLPPLEHMNVWDMYFEDRAKNKDKVIESKYYTGGFGFNLYLLGGGTVISGYDDLYRKDVLEPEANYIHLDFYLQISRFVLSLGYYNSGIEGIDTDDLTVGFVVYDSRHLKVRPFLGISFPFSSFTVKDYFCLGTEKEYGSGSMYGKGAELDESFENGGWVFGVSVDYKFATTYFLASDSALTSFALTSRFGVSTIDLEGNLVKGNGYMAFFSLGLGIYLW